MNVSNEAIEAAPRGTAKCNICGRFRRWADVVTVDYSDSHSLPLVQECKTCTPSANLGDGERNEH